MSNVHDYISEETEVPVFKNELIKGDVLFNFNVWNAALFI